MNSHLESLLGAFDPTLPLERARTIPAAWYHDSQLQELERQAVFGASWQAVGRVDQVAGAGAYLTADVAGEPVAVVRGPDDVLRAFSNVCRHRAAPVLTELCGAATKLRCRYHGWTYDLLGRLRGVPEFEGVADFNREESGLPELAVGVWGPLVWVHLGRPEQPLDEFLQPLTAGTAGCGVEALRFVERREYELSCNWKVYVDNYLDGGYHVNTVHPGLAGVLDYSRYRTELHPLCSVQSSPLVAAKGDDAAARVRTGDRAQYWWLFPNFMLNLYRGVMDANLVLPLGPNRCRVIFDFYFAETEGEKARAFIRESIAVAEQIQQEDVGICEEVQRGLNSRSFQAGRFSVKREAAAYQFHQLLARRLAAAAAVSPSSPPT
jgi:choline monooxygenase